MVFPWVSPLNPMKPPFSLWFSMVVLWFSYGLPYKLPEAETVPILLPEIAVVAPHTADGVNAWGSKLVRWSDRSEEKMPSNACSYIYIYICMCM